MSFNDLNSACKGLLVTAAEVLNSTGLKYVVAGGWVPILADRSHPTLAHPGTRDVDVLLTDEETAVAKAASALLAAGFRPSAKHEFQLLRDAKVGEREFVFNIDLMHPAESTEELEMYNDIFDLGVPDKYDPTQSRHLKSIAFSSSSIIFEENLFEDICINAPNLDGVERSVKIRILSPAAAILSKCESVAVPKRTRDAFDIYYMVSGSRGKSYADGLRSLANKNEQVKKHLQNLRAFLELNSDRFNSNIEKHARQAIPMAAQETLNILFSK